MNAGLKGMIIAGSVAALFGCSKGGAAGPTKTAPQPAGTTAAAAGGETIKCLGVNTCHNTSECAVPGGNDCAGQNTCSKKGWIKLTAEECTAKGGKAL